MATAAQQVLLSPAELAYLHSSLSLTPPIRPDGRTPTQFRPLTAETGILPGTNGSARVCFSDGTEAIVGIKAELEKTATPYGGAADEDISRIRQGDHVEDGGAASKGRSEWLEMTVEIPGLRDDEASTVFLASMLSEALLADGEFAKKLYINRRFHWKLYLDILLISPPLSYPLPLLSLTTHLALLATRVPRLKSEGDEDPMFDDDWQASTFLYPRNAKGGARPPVTLLVVAVGGNIIFDPAKEELAVAEQLRLLSVRTVDPPSRLTPSGVPNSENPATSVSTPGKKAAVPLPGVVGYGVQQGVWRPPIGGTKFAVLEAMIGKVLEKGGVADEVLDGLEGVDLV
ncbi:Zinc-binding alcohol dehydrogenase domain-containing protein cipB [Verticillium dahliae VDG2]|nr:Zinc-binding alcohol dehydrogenase domain-containing protein cipB [Verticillium dahliae VDG2]